MKKVLRIFFTGILGFFAFSFILSGLMAKITALTIMGLVIAFLSVKVSGILPGDRMKEQEKTKEKERLKQLGFLESVYLVHESGLPIVEGAECDITYYKDKITIEGSNSTFNLSTDRIIDMEIKTTTEIERFYNSSIGGAVGGALVLGPLGAMIGGRKKKKEVKTTEEFLVITYDKDDEINFIVFNTAKAPFKVEKFVKTFKETGSRMEKIIDL